MTHLLNEDESAINFGDASVGHAQKWQSCICKLLKGIGEFFNWLFHLQFNAAEICIYYAKLNFKKLLLATFFHKIESKKMFNFYQFLNLIKFFTFLFNFIVLHLKLWRILVWMILSKTSKIYYKIVRKNIVGAIFNIFVNYFVISNLKFGTVS